MFAFLIGKQNLVQDDTHKNQSHMYNRKLDSLEIDIRKKFNEINYFNPEECFDSDRSHVSLRSGKSELSGVRDKSLNNSKTNALYEVNKKKSQKIVLYKRLSTIAEIIVAFLIVSTSIISLIENEKYYNTNFEVRVVGILIINSFISNSTIKYNPGSIFDNIALNELIKERSNQTNEEILDAIVPNGDYDSIFNINNNTEYSSDINLPLVIPDDCESLRVILLTFSCFAISLSIIQRYLEYMKEYIYKNEDETPFIKTEYCLYTLIETGAMAIFQYPTVNTYLLQSELGNTIILPVSSCLAAISIFKLFYLFKVFKNITKWNSIEAEQVCEKYACKASSAFAFKALQKEYPFLTLSIIFVLTCVCFGFSLRIFELYYWETQINIKQDWTFEWNAMWCIFVSMTTVGYGDFYPKTHLGRFIVIIACVIGTYFVSMMMVFMTQKSILNETEFKAYKLITRLKLRKEIKDFQSKMIHHCLKMSIIKKEIKSISSSEQTRKNLDIKYSYEKRCVISLIEKIKSKYRAIKTFEFIPTKEQLFDVCERIDTDIKEIKEEIESLSYINTEIMGYTDSQIEVVKYLKKNIYATRLMYTLIDQNKIFGKLNNVDMKLIELDDEYEKQSQNDSINSDRILSNNNSKIEKSLNDSRIENRKNDKIDIILNYNVTSEEIKNHFEFLFLSQKKDDKRRTHKGS